MAEAAIQYCDRNWEALSNENRIRVLSSIRFPLVSPQMLVSLHSKFPNYLPPDFHSALVRRLCIAERMTVPPTIRKPVARGASLPQSDLRNGILIEVDSPTRGTLMFSFPCLLCPLRFVLFMSFNNDVRYILLDRHRAWHLRV